MKTLSGNQVREFDLRKVEKTVLAHSPYLFYHVKLQAEKFRIGNCASVTLFIVNCEDGAEVHSGDIRLQRGDAIRFENHEAQLEVRGGSASVLVVGTPKSLGLSEICVMPAQTMKIVTKPWGRETWITGEHPLYCLKRIELSKGNRTSLQYHRIKRETLVLVEGIARFSYKGEPHIPNDEVTDSDINHITFSSTVAIDIYPETLHRLEAVTDLLLYEASTPELDDVIRVKDDTFRSNGKISSEHGPS